MQIAETESENIKNLELNLSLTKNCNIAIVEFLKGLLDSEKGEEQEEMNNAIKLKNGYYTIREQINNKKLQVYGKTKKEVQSKMKELQYNLNKIKFLDFYNHWLNDYKIPLLKQNSIKSITQIYNTHILPKLKDKFIQDINTNDLKQIIENVSKEKERTRTIIYNYLNNLFKFAIKENVLEYNPIQNIYIKKNNGNKKRAMTIEEQRKLESYLKNNYSIYNSYFLFLLNTGTRRQEALDIKFEDIDCINKIISIHGTKTKSSERKIPVNDYILSLIDFTRDKPFPFQANAVQHNFKKIIQSLGLNDTEITLHTLRHTFATRALEKGINAKVLQKWLGHSSIKITMDIYSDVQSEFEKQEFLKLKINLLD